MLIQRLISFFLIIKCSLNLDYTFPQCSVINNLHICPETEKWRFDDMCSYSICYKGILTKPVFRCQPTPEYCNLLLERMTNKVLYRKYFENITT